MIKRFGLGLLGMISFSTLVWATLYQEAYHYHSNPLAIGAGNSTVAGPQLGAASLLINPANLAQNGPFYQHVMMDLQHQRFSEGYGNFFQLGQLGFGSIRLVTLEGQALDGTIIGFGNRGRNGVDWGLSYKNFHSAASGSSWSADLGMKMPLTSRLTLGINFIDFIKSADGPDTAINTGAFLDLDLLQLSLSADYSKLEDYGLRFRPGGSLMITNGLKIRGGWFNQHYTVGASIALPIIEVSYAAQYPEKGTGESQYYLMFSLGKGAQNATTR